jgi:hypothetical protein
MPNYEQKELEDMVKLLEQIFERLGGDLGDKKNEDYDEFDTGRFFVLNLIEKTKKKVTK